MLFGLTSFQVSIKMATPSLKALLLLDASDGTRLHAKYYANEFRDLDTQLAFEKSLFTKTRGQNAKNEAEIVMLDNVIAAFRSGIDVTFFVVGAADENELVLATVLEGYFESLMEVLRSQVDKRTLLDNLELVLLTVDELADGGLILETDPAAIASRVLMRDAQAEVPIAELTIAQALASAREQFAKSFRN